MSSTTTIYVGNDNLIEVRGLYDEGADAYVNDATVTCTLVDASGNEISGETWPITLSYVSGSNGNYQGVLTDALSLTAGRKVIAQISADGGTDALAYWEIDLAVKNRVS